MRPINFALLNLSRRKFSTLIALIAISLSICIGLILYKVDLLRSMQYQMIVTEFDSVVGAKSGGIDILLGALNAESERADYIPFNLYRSIRAKEYVMHSDGVATQPTSIQRVIGLLYIGSYKSHPVAGIDLDYFFNRSVSGRPLQEEANEVIIGGSLAAKNRLSIGSNIQVQSKDSSKVEEFEVVGILNERGDAWDYMAFTSLTMAQKYISDTSIARRTIWNEKIISYFMINMPPSGFSEMRSLIDARTVAQFISVREELRNLDQIRGTNKKLSLVLMGIILLLGALTVTAVLILRFDALSGAIAILRSIGYTKSEINMWLLLEGLIIGVIACFAGFLLKLVLFPTIKGITDLQISPFVESQVGVLSTWPVLFIAVVACIFATFVPLWATARQDVHNLLRS